MSGSAFISQQLPANGDGVLPLEAGDNDGGGGGEGALRLGGMLKEKGALKGKIELVAEVRTTWCERKSSTLGEVDGRIRDSGAEAETVCEYANV